MRRWALVVIAIAVVTGSIVAFRASRPPPFDAFPLPPSPSLTPDGDRVFTMLPGASVSFTSQLIAPGDLIACVGVGRTSVPPLGSDIHGRIVVDTSPNGDVIASCAPHLLAEV